MSKLNELIKKYCPNGVEYKKVNEIATEMFRGAGIRREDVSQEGIPCVRYGEIYTSYGISFDRCISHVNPDKVPSKKILKKNDLLFAITGESVLDIGKCTAYLGNEEGLVGGDILVIRHNQNAKYLSYALSTDNAIEQKGRGRVKSKVVHTNANSIGEIKIPLPPIEIQNEIVNILDKLLLNKDNLIRQLNLELEAREKEYNYYLNKLLAFDEEDN